MNKIIILFFCLPIFAFSTTNADSTKSGKQLSKITSDTFNGKFDQIQIFYDQLNRVVRICQTTNEVLKQKTGNSYQLNTHFLRTQDFEYTNSNAYPTLRKRAIYKYDSAKGRDVIRICQVQYFKYAHGQRVGDSIFNTYVSMPIRSNNNYEQIIGETITHQEDGNASPDILHEASYEITSNSISRKHREGRYRSPSGSFTDNLTFGKNLINADYEVHQFNNDVFGYYFKFEKFDQAINPLKSLNIARYISSEIFDFTSFDLDPEEVPINKDNPPCLPSNYLGWSYLNENNPISFTKNGSDGRTRHECPIKNFITVTYNYNAFNLPARCEVNIKTKDIRGREEDRHTVGTEKRRFNFTYNK